MEKEKSYEEYQEEFLKIRKNFIKKFQMLNVFEKEKVFNDAYEDLCFKAVGGDEVAQDFLGYLFKHGFEEFLLENIETSLKWQILAGANGNKLSIKKMSLFLNYSVETIFDQEDFATIRDKNQIFQENYMYIFGKLICEGIVDDMHIDALDLSKLEMIKIPYNPKSIHLFEKAQERAMPKILGYLRS